VNRHAERVSPPSRVSWWGAAFAFLLSGCFDAARSPGADQTGQSNPPDTLAHPRPEASPSYQEYDFGAVLARGQTLRHDFILTNPTRSPVHLLRARPQTPCCSAIGPLPSTILPGGTANVPVSFSLGSQTGHKRLEFWIETDSPSQPLRTLVMTASLFSEWEVEPLAGAATRIPVGGSGRQLFRVTARRKGNDGQDFPHAVMANAPLVARFTGDGVEEVSPNGMVGYTRQVEVCIPPGDQPGRHRGELVFQWDADHALRHPLGWQVTPTLHGIPPALVIKSSANLGAQSVVIRSDDRPVRITGVSGATLLGAPRFPLESKRLHELRLEIDPRGKRAGGASDVLITTDHPHQERVHVSVLILPQS
jgi:hypothetical protein